MIGVGRGLPRYGRSAAVRRGEVRGAYWLLAWLLQVDRVEALSADRSGMIDADYGDELLDFFSTMVKCAGLKELAKPLVRRILRRGGQACLRGNSLPDLLAAYPWLRPEPMDDGA